jgi:hypothetical protein
MEINDDLPEGIEPYQFKIPLTAVGDPDPALFITSASPATPSRSDKEWVREAVAEIKANPERKSEILHVAPSAPALRSLQRSLEQYDGPMPVTKEQWQNFVLQKYWEQAIDIDPKVSKPALDSLAKTSVVALHSDMQEVNINIKSTVELEAELLNTVQNLLQKKEKVIEAEEAEWTE